MAYGASSASSAGEPTLSALTQPFAGAPLYLAAQGVAASAPLAVGFSLSSAASIDLGDGLVLNVGVPLIADPLVGFADPAGTFVVALPAAPLALAGLSVFAQFVALDGAAGASWASSRGLQLDF